MADIEAFCPAILDGERIIIWVGVDSTTPSGCTLVVAEVLGILTTYIMRDDAILGRIEIHDGGQQHGYVGARLKGGELVMGFGQDSRTLAEAIVSRATAADAALVD